ncbi:DUF2795 domain-containing protein [Nocardia higoensis]|uniref:DUF2795 domain-containing protein n=1 Tax=Nocardia higoensis TaxID=228599 RepID=A0ABS0DBB3_9NOCA|nr:DUF2795 domain-containing protein [Nocardia higoensis]MBF6354179.1 DUF2795 domain-containing protein [Nocardia higoensis]
MATTDADRLHRALKEFHFPAAKEELVQHAIDAGSDRDTIRALRAIPPAEYANLAEVIQSVSLDDGRSAAERAAQHRQKRHPTVTERERPVPVNPIVQELGVNRGS